MDKRWYFFLHLIKILGVSNSTHLRSQPQDLRRHLSINSRENDLCLRLLSVDDKEMLSELRSFNGIKTRKEKRNILDPTDMLLLLESFKLHSKSLHSDSSVYFHKQYKSFCTSQCLKYKNSNLLKSYIASNRGCA